MMNAPHQAGTTLSAYHLPGFFFICFFFTEFFLFCASEGGESRRVRFKERHLRFFGFQW